MGHARTDLGGVRVSDHEYLRSEAQRISTASRQSITVAYRRGQYTFTITAAGITETISGFSYKHARLFLIGFERGAIA